MQVAYDGAHAPRISVDELVRLESVHFRDSKRAAAVQVGAHPLKVARLQMRTLRDADTTRVGSARRSSPPSATTTAARRCLLWRNRGHYARPDAVEENAKNPPIAQPALHRGFVPLLSDQRLG